MMNVYIKPEMEVINIEVERLVATSLPIEQEKDGVAETQGRRRTWGNLWE